MTEKELSRRNFIKGTIGAGMALTGAGFLESCSGYDAKGLPTVILGKTGVRIPRVGLGLGSRFCEIDDEDTALALLGYALDNGLYYWDTAWIYENKKNSVISEERIGKVLKVRRNEVFISTKVSSREPTEAMQQIETSLRRLQTDRLDMLNIHNVLSLEDVDRICEKGNLLDIVNRIKDEGVTRFIGFSGHSNVEAIMTLAKRGNFDNVIIAMNHWRAEEQQKREELAIPVALKKGVGIMLIKAIRPMDTIPGINATELVRYALSLKGISGVIIGMDSKKIVDANLEILRNFQPMTSQEMTSTTTALAPFFKHEAVQWMKKDYCDGHWG